MVDISHSGPACVNRSYLLISDYRVCQIIGVVYQVAELVGLFRRKKEYTQEGER